MIAGIKHTSLKQFEERRQLIQNLLDHALDANNADIRDMALTPQASGLLLETIKAFCNGGWIATVILAQATIDADINQNKRLEGLTLNQLRTGKGYTWMRNRRNTLLHADGNQYSLTPHDLIIDEVNLKHDAEKALKLTLHGLTDLFD
jgi:hypothetical protein